MTYQHLLLTVEDRIATVTYVSGDSTHDGGVLYR